MHALVWHEYADIGLRSRWTGNPASHRSFGLSSVILAANLTTAHTFTHTGTEHRENAARAEAIAPPDRDAHNQASSITEGSHCTESHLHHLCAV